MAWFAQPPDARIQRCSAQRLPVRAIDGDRMQLDQDLIVPRDWDGDLGELQHSRCPVAGTNNRLHPFVSSPGAEGRPELSTPLARPTSSVVPRRHTCRDTKVLLQVLFGMGG